MTVNTSIATASEPAALSPSVEFWFDPACPWCWMTSRWLSEVAQLRNFDVVWHPVSLAIINEGKDAGSHAAIHAAGLRYGRVVVAAQQRYGDEISAPLYTEFGMRIHPGARSDVDTIITEALAALELDAALSAAQHDSTHDTTLRAHTAHALDIAGPDVGVPVISVNGVAFFGPVVSPAPSGDAALQLWDGIVQATRVPGFFELKRGRTAGPQFTAVSQRSETA